jgi:hypothetical protein
MSRAGTLMLVATLSSLAACGGGTMGASTAGASNLSGPGFTARMYSRVPAANRVHRQWANTKHTKFTFESSWSTCNWFNHRVVTPALSLAPRGATVTVRFNDIQNLGTCIFCTGTSAECPSTGVAQ